MARSGRATAVFNYSSRKQSTSRDMVIGKVPSPPCLPPPATVTCALTGKSHARGQEQRPAGDIPSLADLSRVAAGALQSQALPAARRRQGVGAGTN